MVTFEDVRKGDIDFLWNIDTNELLGISQAESKV